MKTVRSIMSLIVLLTMLLACNKQIYDIVDAEEKKLAGKYAVSLYRETVYDSTGRELSKNEYKDNGSIELIMNTNNGGDVFSHFIFYDPARYTYIPSRIAGQYKLWQPRS